MRLKDGSPLWGLISKDNERKLNLSTLRKKTLYLPGGSPIIEKQNTTGTHFASIALDMTYETGSSSLSTTGALSDYSGRSNLATYKKWQELLKDPGTSAKILNFIWTDIAVNMMVGTKGLHLHDNSKNKRDGAASGSKMPAVLNYTRRIQYKYVYGIPAFLTLAQARQQCALFFNTHLLGAFLHCKMDNRLTRAMPISHDDGYTNVPTAVWKHGTGKQLFTLGAAGWTKNVEYVPGYESKGGATVEYAPVPNP